MESLDLDIVKKFISTVEKSRLSFFNFVSTCPEPKSFNQDQEICQDLEILAFLDSLSQSQSRSKWILAYFSLRFLNTSQLYIIFRLKKFNNVEISWQILICLNKWPSLDWRSLHFKNLNLENPNVCLYSQDNINGQDPRA